MALFPDLVRPFARGVLGRFDLLTALAANDADKAPHRVRLTSTSQFTQLHRPPSALLRIRNSRLTSWWRRFNPRAASAIPRFSRCCFSSAICPSPHRNSRICSASLKIASPERRVRQRWEATGAPTQHSFLSCSNIVAHNFPQAHHFLCQLWAKAKLLHAQAGHRRGSQPRRACNPRRSA